jgi:hypothetical protein
MAESYKILAQIATTDTAEKVLYTSPAGTQTIITNITAVNRTSSAQSFDINVYNSAKTNSDFTSTVANSIFVATVEGSSIGMYSTDGITWTSMTTVYNYAAGRIAVGPAGFLLPPVNYNASAIVSTNGISWTESALPDYTGWWGAGYGNGTYVLAGDGEVVTSADLVTWTKTVVGDFNYSQIKAGITYNQNKFVAAGSNGSVFTSPDGATWTSRTTSWSNSGVDLRSIASSPSAFVAVGGRYSNTTEAMYSSDGITWAAKTMPSSMAWSSVAYGAGKFVAVGYPSSGSSTTAAASSTDGITWTARTMPSSTTWSNVAYNGAVFIALPDGNTASAASSTDGITWTARTSTGGYMWHSVGADLVTYPYTSPKINNIYKGVKIQASTSEILEPGIVLGAQNSIVVKGTANTTFSVYGVEIS